MLHVHLPFPAEHRLAGIQRKQLLENNEHGAGRQQIQDEPVQAQIRVVAGIGAGHHHIAAARRDGDAHQHEGGDIEPALAPQHGIGQRDRARHQQRAEQQGAHRVHRIKTAQLRRGQIGWKMKRQHAQHGKNRQKQRDDSAHHSRARVDPAVPLE